MADLFELDIIGQLCTGLHFAHESGVIHRDVKPANVWLLDDGTVKLLDFGIARLLNSTMTRGGDLVGSVSYMAPELVSGGDVNGRADIFAAGVVAYELLSGRRPFEANTPTAVMSRIINEEPPDINTLVPDLPGPLVSALGHALQKDPEQRYRSAGDFGADLSLVRVTLQSTGSTMLGEVELAETMYAPLPETIGVAPPAAAPVDPTPVSITDRVGPVAKRARLLAQMVLTRVKQRGWLWAAGTAAVLVVALAVALRPETSEPEPIGVAEESTTDVNAVGPVPAPIVDMVVRVMSEPSGATITLDGSDADLVTPTDLQLAGGFPRRLELTMEGFEPFTVDLTENDVAAGEVVYALVPLAPPLTAVLTGSYPFELRDGDEVVSTASTSHTVTVREGQTLVLRAPEYFLNRTVNVNRGSDGTARIRAPELGFLTVRTAFETCPLSLGGRRLGFPPIVNQAVAAGTHVLRLTCPDGTTHRSQVVIRSGQVHVELIR